MAARARGSALRVLSQLFMAVETRGFGVDAVADYSVLSYSVVICVVSFL